MATFRELAALCEALGRTRSRRELARRVADFLAGLAPDEVRPAVRLLLGQAGGGDTAPVWDLSRTPLTGLGPGTAGSPSADA